jgi:hypothetical protein
MEREISPENKQLDEEIAKAEAERSHPTKSMGWTMKVVICVVIYFVVVGFIKIVTKSAPNEVKTQQISTPAPAKQTTFVASVNFTGTQFVISNLDPHTCENARMQVNSDYSLDGYNLESGLTSATKSGEVTVYKVGAGQFTKKDGARFNSFATKPQNFYIECRGNNELTNAYWYGTF